MVPRKRLRLLDFDLENRPLSYLGSDYTTAEITALACSFGPRSPIATWVLGIDEPELMLWEFKQYYDSADIVTGHYIIRHDLPILNAAYMEYGMDPLGPKMVSDTKIHMIKKKDLSGSQEGLAAMLGVRRGKFHMSPHDWRVSNRLERLDLTRKRVTWDVRQHQELRKKMVENGLLGPPRMWHPVTRGY